MASACTVHHSVHMPTDPDVLDVFEILSLLGENFTSLVISYAISKVPFNSILCLLLINSMNGHISG